LKESTEEMVPGLFGIIAAIMLLIEATEVDRIEFADCVERVRDEPDADEASRVILKNLALALRQPEKLLEPGG